MIDNLKLEISHKNPEVFDRLFRFLVSSPDYVQGRPTTKGFHTYYHKRIGSKLRFDLRKVQQNGEVIGYREIYLIISPHYHFNHYKHNGNDFTPENCIKTILAILASLQIKPHEYIALKVVNIEFGLNIVTDDSTTSLVDGLLLYKRTQFIVPDKKYPYSKITDTTPHKEIKAYDKGIQFIDFPQYRIDRNTFRFEVSSKQSKNIRKYGINTISDFLLPKTYNILIQELIKEWDFVLVANNTDVFRHLKSEDKQFINNATSEDFWKELDRVKFARFKDKYYAILGSENNIHFKIKIQMIDKLFSYQNVTFSTNETIINIEKVDFEENLPDRINLENVTLPEDIKISSVIGLESFSQKVSKTYLSPVRLKCVLQRNHLILPNWN